jgi:antirestriction protein ArdC
MTRTANKPNTRRDLYEEVTETIASALEAGVAPWVKPWKVTRDASGLPADWPRNGASGRPYNGINVWLLFVASMAKGYTDPRWLTFNQAKNAGGSVRKGEKSTTVVFWKVLLKDADGNTVSPKDAKGRADLKKVFFLRHFSLFNVDQCDDLDLSAMVTEVPDADDLEATRNGNVETILAVLNADGCPVRRGGNRAFYSITEDAITLPKSDRFIDAGAEAATALHEAVHATGADSRLARQFGQRFGDDAYAFEELVAEMGSAYLCAAAGVDGTLQHPEYLAHWAQVLRSDNRAIFTAAKSAAAASDWLLDRAGLSLKVDQDQDEVDAAA